MSRTMIYVVVLQLFPGRRVAGYARLVVANRTNSDAQRVAMQRFPGYGAG